MDIDMQLLLDYINKLTLEEKNKYKSAIGESIERAFALSVSDEYKNSKLLEIIEDLNNLVRRNVND